MKAACLIYIKGSKPSKLDPLFLQIIQAINTIRRNLRYFRQDPFSGYLEIAMLPYGLGYNEHPAYIIDEIELVKNCYNDAKTQLKPKKKGG